MKKNPLNISRFPPPTYLTFVPSKWDTRSGCSHHLTVHVHVKKKGQSELLISRKSDIREHGKTASYIRNAYFCHRLKMCSEAKILKDLQQKLAKFFCKGLGKQIFQAFWTTQPLSQLLSCCCSSNKRSYRQYGNGWAWPCCNETVLMNTEIQILYNFPCHEILLF